MNDIKNKDVAKVTKTEQTPVRQESKARTSEREFLEVLSRRLKTTPNDQRTLNEIADDVDKRLRDMSVGKV